MTAPAFTVSGPGVDRQTISAGAGASLAITHACRAKAEATFYVRDVGGRTMYRVERDALGMVLTWRTAP